MTQSQSEKFISILIHMKKHPEMLIDKPCMSYLDAFQLGFVMGCNSSDVVPTNERSEYDFFVKSLCDKYSINSPWYNSLIEYCNSDEKAYELFMNEFELFLNDKEKYINNSL